MPEMQTVITATSFKGKRAVEAVAMLRPGHEVKLYREPQNRHDPNAIMCSAFDLAIGYIPKICNSALAAAMDDGIEPMAIVIEAALVAGRVIHEPKISVTW